MKRDLGNFTRGSQLIEHFGFKFAAGLKGPLIIALIVVCWMTWWTVLAGMTDHEVYLAWTRVYAACYHFMEFDPAHDSAVQTAPVTCLRSLGNKTAPHLPPVRGRASVECGRSSAAGRE